MKPGLYRVCKKYGKHGYYDTLDGGEGVVHNYWLKAKVSLYKNSLLMFSHHDDVGNVHFVTCDHNKTIAFKHAASALDFIERVPDAE